ncbi:hypothetical protein PGTUg99_036195 [Puccinia graminis f. sp. tritici]|uniref:Uncharacterized protein n=1 Tax=Puccinia graminis f. sp. tritici TaxID=56615 RepID=A0A5B0S907_PUCGR|nr:hypothetical protein PGTUg99_036195 [Puccinia graminis f. sp. tritici]
MKQTTLTSYPAFDKPGGQGNPLVIDSDGDIPIVHGPSADIDIESNGPDVIPKSAQKTSMSEPVVLKNKGNVAGLDTGTNTDSKTPNTASLATIICSDSEAPGPVVIPQNSPQASSSEGIDQHCTRPSPTGSDASKAMGNLQAKGPFTQPNQDASTKATDTDLGASIMEYSTNSLTPGVDGLQTKLLGETQGTITDGNLNVCGNTTDTGLQASNVDSSTKTLNSEFPMGVKAAQKTSWIGSMVEECQKGSSTRPDALTHMGAGTQEGQEHTPTKMPQ